jgi:hypothetical protein
MQGNTCKSVVWPAGLYGSDQRNLPKVWQE